MKPIPAHVLRLIETLPAETQKITVNTDGKDRWVVETYARYVVTLKADRSPTLRRPTTTRSSKSSY